VRILSSPYGYKRLGAQGLLRTSLISIRVFATSQGRRDESLFSRSYLKKEGPIIIFLLEEDFVLLQRKEGRGMRRIMIATALVLVLVFGYAVAKSVAHEMMSKSGETSDLLGSSVKNPQGEDLGTIADVVTGPEGRVAFAVLSYWISDDTQKRVAVPFSALSCEEQNCVLNANKDALNSAPAFVSGDDLAERKLAEDIYTHFGVQPYWTEEGEQK